MKPSMQEYYEALRTELSARANHILDFGRFGKATDVLARLTDKEKILLLRNCGIKTVEEIFDMVCRLKEYKVSTAEIMDNKCDRKNIASTLDIPIENLDFSVRSLNCLKKTDVATLGDLVSFNKSDLAKLRGFGKKVLQEIENVVLSHGLEFGMQISSYHQEDTKQQDSTSHISNILNNCHLSNTDKNYCSAFKDKYGHFPMVFISYKALSFLTENERKVLRMVIETSQPLSVEEIAIRLCLTRERIRQIYDKASKRIRASSTIKQLFQNGDWCVYGMGEDTSFVFSSDLHADRIIEERDFLIEYMQSNKNTDWQAPNITENSIYLMLVMKGMVPIWIDKEKKELSLSGQTAPLIFIDERFNQYKFNKAIREFCRLHKVKKTESVLVPITSYFIDNDCYWRKNSKPEFVEKDKLKELLIRIFCVVGVIHMEGECIVFEYNKIGYGNLLYELLKKAATRLHREELLHLLMNECSEQGVPCDFTDSSQLTTFLTKDPRIISIGKSGYWGLKEWGEITGSIRNIAIKMVKKSRDPIQIEDLANMILLHRPDSAFDNVATIIRQSVYMGEFVLFFDDYIGLKGKKYNAKYVKYPNTFDEWVDTYRQFVQSNRHLPYCGQNGYEGYLYRWHYKASQLIDLSTEEILKFDALEKELSHYPQNATEYNFLQNCNLYKKFVASNKRMLTKEDDSDLFNWFYKYSRSFSSLDDNRNKYFGQLLQSLSAILY